MSSKRKVRPGLPAPQSGASLAVLDAPAEAPHPGEAAPAAAAAPKPVGTALIWRVLGGALAATLIILAFTIYQHMHSQLNQLRGELATLNKETRRDLATLGDRHAGLTKRADHDSRVRLIWDSLKELRNDRSDLGRLKERCGLLLDLYKAGEDERRALLADVRRLSEKKTGDDSQALVRELRTLRERIAQLESAPKAKLKPVSHVEEQDKP